MRKAIAGARREVLVEAYVFRDDAVGRAFLDELGKATARGVVVRVLADAFGSIRTRRAFWREMEARGVEVRLFHHLFHRPWYQPFRDHRKLLVVDRRLGFTGGMNIGEEYGNPPAGEPTGGAEGSGESGPRTWRDTAVRVEGSAAWEMAVVFAEGWRRAGGSPLHLGPAKVGPGEGPGETDVLVLDSRPRRGHVESASVLAAILAAARERLWITTAYFAPARLAVSLLRRTARRGVDVRLMLPGRTDVPLARHAGHAFFGRLLRAGVRIWEYEPAVLHAKSLVADGRVSVVGSSNVDMRSFRFNAECNVVLIGEGPARELEAAFRDDVSRARELRPKAWAARPPWHRLGDRAARLLVPLL